MLPVIIIHAAITFPPNCTQQRKLVGYKMYFGDRVEDRMQDKMTYVTCGVMHDPYGLRMGSNLNKNLKILTAPLQYAV